MSLTEAYNRVRQRSEQICSGLKTEDYVVQPVIDVSPPKWHLGHTTWFWETFLLIPHLESYQLFDKEYNYVFNSYYESVGARVIRTDRGNLSRPSVDDVYRYRNHVDESMNKLLGANQQSEVLNLILLGLNHEEQHQELLLTDIKYILGHNPLFPSFDDQFIVREQSKSPNEYISIREGVYEIGYAGEGFCFDNELGRHKVYLQGCQVSRHLVTNAEYLEFINSDGYGSFQWWLADGWEWRKQHHIQCPLYWHLVDGKWMNYTYSGLEELSMEEPVCHISYYEAAAFASWRGQRLLTEFEWEVASAEVTYGRRWEWTESAYLPYPGFSKAPGAIGEYNGKFMINQMVLRGSSDVTTPGHSRPSYRNFFSPQLRWQYTGIRLAK